MASVCWASLRVESPRDRGCVCWPHQVLNKPFLDKSTINYETLNSNFVSMSYKVNSLTGGLSEAGIRSVERTSVTGRGNGRRDN